MILVSSAPPLGPPFGGVLLARGVMLTNGVAAKLSARKRLS